MEWERERDWVERKRERGETQTHSFNSCVFETTTTDCRQLSMYFGLCHNVVCFGVVVVVADLAQHSTAKSSFHSLLLSIQFAVVSGMEKYTQRQTGAGPDSFSRCMALKHCMCLCIDKHFRIYRKSVVCIERCLQLTVCVRVLYLYLYGILVGKKQQRQQQIEFETTSRLGEHHA